MSTSILAPSVLDTLGKRLRVCRTCKGLRLGALAELAATSAPYLSMIENDTPGKTPSLALLQRLSAALDVTVSQLIGETPLA